MLVYPHAAKMHPKTAQFSSVGADGHNVTEVEERLAAGKEGKKADDGATTSEKQNVNKTTF